MSRAHPSSRPPPGITPVDVLVVGSGAGGASTALELATAGANVCVLEQGERHDLRAYGRGSAEAMQRLYKRGGMTPIEGSIPIGYVEGACVGGSTEINSGFWHRTPREVLLRWEAQFDLRSATTDDLAPHFEHFERILGVGPYVGPRPMSTQVFQRGIDAMGWAAQEVPRAAPGCQSSNACAEGCPTGAKQGMSRKVLPSAEAAGARLLTGCTARLILTDGPRVVGVLAELERPEGTTLVRINAEHVFVCGGPTETPALLRRSGVKRRVGDSLRVHPMLKVAARFDERIEADRSVLPILQVKEFWPDVSLGGAFFTAGHLAMQLGDNWLENWPSMADADRMAAYYVAVRGSGRGSVRPSWLGEGAPVLRYELSERDVHHLSQGLARLSMLLLAAGAIEVRPSVQGLPVIRTEVEAARWLDEDLPRSALSLTTVHAFSSCPIGERVNRCAADSFGRVHGYENLYVNDASMLPDSPGVNPQGSVMAIARRNAVHFLESIR